MRSTLTRTFFTVVLEKVSHVIRKTPLAALLVLGAAQPAFAQVRPSSVELHLNGGLWEGDGVLDNGPTFGGGVGFNVNRVFGVEANYTLVLTQLTTRANPQTGAAKSEEDKTAHQFGLNAVVHLADGPLVPYLTAGAGFVKVDDLEFAHNIGVGAKYFITDLVGVRLDFRGWFSPDAPATDEYAHFAATLGLDLQLGGNYDIDDDGIPNRDDQCVSQAEDKDQFKDEDGCPETDNDADGVLDQADKCINEAEDKDGDRDDDGCPDLDDDGDGIKNDVDKCVTEAEDKDGFQDEDGCPEDNDADGIADAADKCPADAEDKDNFEDADGCPDKDNDRDGILDATDKCPDQAEIINSVDDTDGCPDEGKVKLTEAKIEILEKVFFKTGKDAIDAKSFALLDQVSAVLVATPRIKKIRVEGHTDNVGKAKKNTQLSQKRADAVKKYLVSKGVEDARLEAIGFGPDKPIADNATDEGKEANRRVEFVIVE